MFLLVLCNKWMASHYFLARKLLAIYLILQSRALCPPPLHFTRLPRNCSEARSLSSLRWLVYCPSASILLASKTCKLRTVAGKHCCLLLGTLKIMLGFEWNERMTISRKFEIHFLRVLLIQYFFSHTGRFYNLN